MNVDGPVSGVKGHAKEGSAVLMGGSVQCHRLALCSNKFVMGLRVLLCATMWVCAACWVLPCLRNLFCCMTLGSTAQCAVPLQRGQQSVLSFETAWQCVLGVTFGHTPTQQLQSHSGGYAMQLQHTRTHPWTGWCLCLCFGSSDIREVSPGCSGAP